MMKALYDAVNKMMANIGALGHISARAPEVTAVMDALYDIDGGVPSTKYQWISVKDRTVTPKVSHGHVLTYSIEVSGCKHRIIPVLKDGKLPHAVTHWMPLPEPPVGLKSSPPEIRGMAEGDAGFTV